MYRDVSRFVARLSVVCLNNVDPVHVYRAFPGADCGNRQCHEITTSAREARTSRANDERICELASLSRDSPETRGIMLSHRSVRVSLFEELETQLDVAGRGTRSPTIGD